MFTLDSSHFLSLCLALSFSTLVHFSFTGFTSKMRDFFIGFALFPVVLMALTLIIPQDFLQYSSYLLLLVGFFLASAKLPTRLQNISSTFKKFDNKEKWIILFIFIYLFSSYMSTTIFRDGGSIQDALVYHLEGPKEWALYLNGAKFNTNNPMSFTTSYYDYYYYFLILLLKPLFLHAAPLASTQYEFISYTVLLAAQTFSGIVAFVYIPLLVLRLSNTLGIYKYLTILFIYGLRLFTWSWILPKNDAYPFLCFILGVEIFYHYYIELKNNKNAFYLFLAALLIGVGTASKMTNAYVVIFSLFFLIAFYYKEVMLFIGNIGLPKTITITSIGLLIGAAVFLIRNYTSTGNPFFPVAKFGFSNIYISDYAYRPQLYSDPESWAGALVKIKSHLIEFPQLILILLAAVFFRLRTLPLFYVAMVIYMSKQTGPMYRFRMTNIFLILDLIIFILVLKELVKLPQFKKNIWFSRILVIILIVFAKVQVEKIIKYPVMYYAQTVGEALVNKHLHWDVILKNNLLNRSNPQYVMAPTEEVFPYFSRYPFISLNDSVPQFRYEYFKK